MSTDTEPSESWPALKAKARQKIAAYQPQKRPREEILQSSLIAFLEWLPENGRESVARDIVNATTDEALYEVFHTLLTGLAVPSKLRTDGMCEAIKITNRCPRIVKARSKQPSITDSPHAIWQRTVEGAASTPEPETPDSTFRACLLQRDGYRCVVTGEMDYDHWESIGGPDNTPSGDIECAHIIPLSYATWDKSSVT